MKRPTLLLILLLSELGMAAAEQNNFLVTGRVLDGQGRAVTGALITVHPAVNPGDLVLFAEADDAGRFRFEGQSSAPVIEEILYVTSSFPKEAYIPITPPFDTQLKDISRSFGGTRVLVKKNERIDLGDVSVQIDYIRVLVYLQNPDGVPLISTREGWNGVWMRIKDPKDRIISEGGLSRKDVRFVLLDQSAIPMALPEGTWSVEVALGGQQGPWFSSESKLVVRKSDRPLSVTVKATRK